jgi:hypothetical protein
MQRVDGEQPEGRHATLDAVPRREPPEALIAAISIDDARRMANLDIALEPCVPVSGTAGEHYLAERGIGPIHEGVGFAPNWPAGVITNIGRESPGYGPAVVFPFVDPDGEAVAAQGRFIIPPVMAGKAMKNWSVGAISRGVFATPDAWESDLVGLWEAPIDALSLAQLDCRHSRSPGRKIGRRSWRRCWQAAPWCSVSTPTSPALQLHSSSNTCYAPEAKSLGYSCRSV